MRAFVAGATGNVGSAVVRHLRTRGHEVRALVRRPDAVLAAGAEPVVGDLDAPADLASSLVGVEGLFLLAGYAGQAELLGVAARAGVRRVVLLSSGSVQASTIRNVVVEYHERAEDEVRDSGLGWTFLRPHTFMSNSLAWREPLAATGGVPLQFASAASSVVDPDDVGEVAAVCLADPGQEGRVHRVTGPEALTPVERLGVLGEVLGRDLRAEVLSDDETYRQLIDAMPEPYVEAFVDFFVRGALDESVVYPGVEDVLGRAPRSWRQWVEAHRSAFDAP